jgi:hypothetical protein
VRPHLIASHYGRARGPARAEWRVAFVGEAPFARGAAETAFALAPGDLRELMVAEFAVPAVAAPRQAILTAEMAIGDERARNSWPLWFFPRDVWRGAIYLALFDPIGRLRDFARIAPGVDDRQSTTDDPNAQFSSTAVGGRSPVVVIATMWTPGLRAFVERGGRAIVLLSGDEPAGPLPTAAMPFWREAVRLAEPHPAWGDFPLDDALALQLFGCAADHALDLRGYAGEWRPMLRRLDTRTMQLHEYALELRIGSGRAIVSTLRFEGGQGTQPAGIARNTAAAYLLWCWAKYLRQL